MTTWDPDGPGPHSEILVVGGDFTSAGTVFSNDVAFWDGAQWHAFGTGLSSATYGAEVHALVEYNGELIAAGVFADIAGAPCNNIARWDGNAWYPLGTGTDARINALTVFGGELIAGGDFMIAGEVAAPAIAAWNGAEWRGMDGGMIAGSTGQARVKALAVYENELVAGGNFESAGSAASSGLARWDGISWHAMQPINNWGVELITVAGNELIVADGWCIERWDGSNWQIIGCYEGGIPECSIQTLALATIENQWLASVTTCCRGQGHGCSELDSWVFGAIDSFDIISGRIFALAAYQGRLIAAGDQIVFWDDSEWKAIDPPPIDGVVSALAIAEEGLFAGGGFSTIDGVTANKVAKWNGESWEPLGVGIGHFGYVSALTFHNGDLIVGGYFQHAGDLSVQNIAAWDGAAWSAIGGGPNSQVNALVEYNGELIAGGYFTEAGGVSANSVAKWNGTNWEPLGEGTNGQVFALTEFNDDLIVAGHFTTAGGVTARNIARWDGTAWSPLGDGIDGAYQLVSTLLVFDNMLAVGGSFTSAGGLTVSGTASWDGETWHTLGANVVTGVNSFAKYRSELIASGVFFDSAGEAAVGLARWDGANWAVFEDRIDSVLTMVEDGDDLLAGGFFYTAGDYISVYLARYGPACPGDLNCDGAVSLDDLAGFIEALIPAGEFNCCDITRADLNADGKQDGRDIAFFVNLLTS